MKIKKYFITLFITCLIKINIIKTAEGNDEKHAPRLGTDYPGIECGKKNPKEADDCKKYGTDSMMLCCFVKKNDEKFCTLLYEERAEGLGINGAANFGDEHWDCGNKSFYLSINIILFLISIFLY